MSTKNVNYIDDDDDDGLAFYYMKSNSGSSGGGSGGGKAGIKNVPSGNAAINVASDKNVQKLKNTAQKAFTKADNLSKKYWKEMEKAQGSNGYINRIEGAKLDKIMEQQLTALQKASAAQKKYEAALPNVPTVGQVNSDGNAIWTSRGGWTNINVNPSSGGYSGLNATAGDLNVSSQLNMNNTGPVKPAFFDGVSWVTVNAA